MFLCRCVFFGRKYQQADWGLACALEDGDNVCAAVRHPVTSSVPVPSREESAVMDIFGGDIRWFVQRGLPSFVRSECGDEGWL